MIVLKQVIHYPDTNSVEATWVDRVQLPDVEVPEQIIPNSFVNGEFVEGQRIPAHTIPGEIVDTVVRCHSYADVQMDMLEADLGADVTAHAALIATVRAGIKPPVPPTAAQIAAQAAADLDGLERATLMNRATREFLLALAEKEGAAAGLTPEQLAAVNPAYKAVKAIDDQAKALRSKLV